MQIEVIDPSLRYLTALLSGVALAVFWCLVVLASKIWAATWAWIDDAKAPKRSPAIVFLMKISGYKENAEGAVYDFTHSNKKSETDAEIAFALAFMFCLIAPIMALLAFDLYPVTIAIMTLYAVAHLARFARRHKKLFDKHIADPDAHKK